MNLCRACPVAQINCQHLRAGLEKKVSTPITVRFATGRVEVWDDAPATINFKQAACAAKTMPITSPRDCAGCLIRLPNVVPQNAIQVAHHAKQNAPIPTPNAVAQTPRASRGTTHVTPPAAQAAAIDVGAANDLIARAQATAARKAEEKRARETERAAREEQANYSAQSEAKPKIIQMKEWLAGQINKKQNSNAPSPYKPQVVKPDVDGVSDIVYSPLGAQTASAYQETVDYERCVGWTD